MLIPVPHSDPQSINAALAALTILYYGSLKAMLAKEVKPTPTPTPKAQP